MFSNHQKYVAIVFLSVFMASLPGLTNASSQPDYPHNPAQGIDCYDCHSFWNFFDPGATSDDLCLDCHDGVQATKVVTHSSANTSNGHGDWEIECKTCHMPHFQEQFRTFGDVSYIYSGTSDGGGITATTLTSSASGWTSDELAGLILIPNLLKDSYNYKIVSNTASTITVNGTIDVARVGSGNTDFAVVYGGLVRGTIDTPNSGPREVRLFNSTGANSFADGDNVWDGVCEVCHTDTSHFKNDGQGSDQLHENYGGKAASNCIGCHSHAEGFAGGRPAPPHDTSAFLNDCYLCHVNNGQDYSEIVPDSKCNQCHTEAGVLRGSFSAAPVVLTHDSVHGSGNFTYSFDCVECHTLMGSPANLKLVSSRVAGSVIPNSPITYTSRSGAGSMADGAPHESNICETCHHRDELNHHWYDGDAPSDKDTSIPPVYQGHYDGMPCTACHSHSNAFVFGGSDSCDACHGNPPVTTSIGGPDGLVELPSPTGSITPGAHAKHAGASEYGYACSNCHTDGMDVDNLVLDDSIQIGFAIFGFSGTNSTYDHQVLDLPYTVSGGNGTDVTPGASMICSNFYCHGDGTAVSTRFFDPPTYPGPATDSPAWDASGPLACDSCHGDPPAYGHLAPKNNAHDRHVGILEFMGDPDPCHVCHYSTTTNGTTITNPANHVNGQYDVVPNTNFIFRLNNNSQYAVNFNYSYDPGSSSCSNISCHTNLISTTHTWGYGSLTASPNTMRAGDVCGEIDFGITVSGGYPSRTPPYVYYIDWGDGTTYEGPDSSHSHIYTDTSPKNVTWNVRDANRLTMLNNSVPTPKVHTITPFSGNTEAIPNFSLVVDGYTVTLTDLSTDPDYNSCGHSGLGEIRVQWVTNGGSFEPIDLTDVPSGRQWTHTYPSTSTTISTIRHYIRDNTLHYPNWITPYVSFTVPKSSPVLITFDSVNGVWVESPL